MFTGIVEGMAEIVEYHRTGTGATFTLDLGPLAEGVKAGDSISCSGCCLTVEKLEGTRAQFSAVSETLSLTILGDVEQGDSLNVERSLRVGSEIGGHFVFGHIDGVGEVTSVIEDPYTVEIRVPKGMAIYLIPKGSVSIDGVSLTIASVDGDRFRVALIPFTLEVTTLGRLEVGDRCNLESDYLARIVRKILVESGVVPG
jgi:riboflavin synthase alpha subunit